MESKRIINNSIGFQAYNVKLGIASDEGFYLKCVLERLDEILPDGFEFIEESEIEHLLEIKQKKDGNYQIIYQIIKEGEVLADWRKREDFFCLIESRIRLTVAEFAKDKVFLHASAVGWRGKAIIIPASSFAGKTTLVAELIKSGAAYYSDEYAILDEDGFVHPYTKKLSMRGIIDDYKQMDVAAESLGAVVGREPLPVGLVLICRFDKSVDNRKEFRAEILSSGQGIIELLAHSISIRNNPAFVLKVLNKVSSRAIIAKTRRGEAELFAARLIASLNKGVFK